MTSSPKTPRKNKRNSRAKPSPISTDFLLDDRLQEGGRYLALVSPKSSPKKRPVVDGTLDSASMPIKTITIMADFGNGPYAWIKDASDESRLVGGNIADDGGGFGEEYGVSAELEKQFADWVARCEHDNLAFGWNAFHREGIALCQHLKQVLGDAYRVAYVKPHEDPNYRMNRRTEIF